MTAPICTYIEPFFVLFGMQIKCKGCGRVNDISLVAEENEDEAVYVADADEWQRLATFECRGVDLVCKKYVILKESCDALHMCPVIQHEYEIRDGYFVVSKDGKSRFDDGMSQMYIYFC